MERVRRSVVAPLDNIFSNHISHRSSNNSASTTFGQANVSEETDYLLPPLNIANNNTISMDGPRPSTAADRLGIAGDTAASSPSDGWFTGMRPVVRRDVRRLPLQGRSSRLIRRDNEAPLSHILRLTAAAIAAQLSGRAPDAVDMEPLGDEDGIDDSFTAFMETITDVATTEEDDHDNGSRALPPLNLVRVFRFANVTTTIHNVGDMRRARVPSGNQNTTNATTAASNNIAQPSSNNNHHEQDLASDEESAEPGTVTLVVVGVRSVPTSTISRDSDEGVQRLDHLLSLPLFPPAPTMGNSVSAARLGGRRRPPNNDPFPSQYESQRHHRNPSSGTNNTAPETSGTIPMVLSESPPGPRPPPSTPADQLSAHASGATTPNYRPLSAAATMPQTENNASVNATTNTILPQVPRQRRRSDSETARHRNLGAGAARRNGVVEPDGIITQGRSWLIYVVGTHISEDHPVLRAPSLLTDVSDLQCLFFLVLTVRVESHVRGHDADILPHWLREASRCFKARSRIDWWSLQNSLAQC
jgi:hypothetical protein